MQDFGETLADIHEHLDGPLPIRVSQWRVFLGALLEALSGITILLRRHHRGSMGLPDFHADLDSVTHEFQSLEGQSCTSAQVEQAQDLFHWAMRARQRRMDYEHRMWVHAVQAGLFLGSLTIALLLMAAFMSVVTDHRWADLFILLFIGVQAVAGFLCHKQWFHP